MGERDVWAGYRSSIADIYDKIWREAYRAGQKEMRQRAADCVTAHYQALSQEHRLLLVNRATAIAELALEGGSHD